MGAMNETQLAALTPKERQLAEAAQLDPGKVFAGEDVLPVLAALANARLEVARLRGLLGEQGVRVAYDTIEQLTEARDKVVEGNQRIVQRNLDLEAEVARLKASFEEAQTGRENVHAYCELIEGQRMRLEAEVARLTAAVEAAQPPDGDCPHGYFVGRDCPEGCTDDEGHNLLREDIERLMECGRALADHVHTEYDANCVKADKMLRVLLDLKGRYDA